MNKLVQIKQNAGRILGELPGHVTLLAAAKTRTIDEVTAAYEGGIRHFGHNYVQEAQGMISGVGFDARWHMIGHLQRNKAGQAIELFHMIESLDSVKLALELEKRCAQSQNQMDVLIEVNSGLEEEKTGISPQQAEDLAWAMSELAHLRLVGLMTMGPFTGDPEDARPYFTRTRRLFEHLGGLGIPNMEMRVLSMGMSNNYRVAIEEGATLVRIGTLLFGPRA
jgi:hypothetical protein